MKKLLRLLLFIISPCLAMENHFAKQSARESHRDQSSRHDVQKISNKEERFREFRENSFKDYYSFLTTARREAIDGEPTFDQETYNDLNKHAFFGQYSIDQATGSYLAYFTNGIRELWAHNGNTWIRECSQDIFEKISPEEAAKLLSPAQAARILASHNKWLHTQQARNEHFHPANPRESMDPYADFADSVEALKGPLGDSLLAGFKDWVKNRSNIDYKNLNIPDLIAQAQNNPQHPFSATPIFHLNLENAENPKLEKIGIAKDTLPPKILDFIRSGEFVYCKAYTMEKSHLHPSDYKPLNGIVTGTINEKVCIALHNRAFQARIKEIRN